MSTQTEIEIEIPCYFICPISMQLMKDPVTVSTGITYDRESIEKWLFSCKNKNVTCPVTKQSLQQTDLTPNLTLRRLIQAWCTLNAHDRIPTPKPSVDKSLIQKLLSNAKKSHQERVLCLHRLSSIAHRNDSSKNYLQQSPGAVDFLLSVVTAKVDSDSRDQALNILRQIELSDSDMKKFLSDDGQIMDALINVLENGNSESRANAVIVLKSVFDVADPCYLIGSRSELFLQTVRILTDKMVSKQAVKAALKLLVEICPWGRNRVKAVESGAVSALIELLLESSERRLCELILIVLDQLCSCADGRAELLRHGAGLAIVSKKVLRVSHVASERAVRIIASICKYSASSRVLMEMLQVGVVTKLCLVLQVESGERTKERAKEMLRLHSRVWKNASCIPSHLLSYYPSSK